MFFADWNKKGLFFKAVIGALKKGFLLKCKWTWPIILRLW
jgi:hypothetical protein